MDRTIPCEFCGLTDFNSRKEFNNRLASHQSSHHYHSCIERTGRGLFNQSEEVMEAAHAKFDIFWRRYKVLDVESESHGEALLNCLDDFNTKNI